MTIDMGSQLIKTSSTGCDNRMYKLLMRCRQEISILTKQLNEPMQLASYAPLQQRLKELEQRQNFYENQIGRIRFNTTI